MYLDLDPGTQHFLGIFKISRTCKNPICFHTITNGETHCYIKNFEIVSPMVKSFSSRNKRVGWPTLKMAVSIMTNFFSDVQLSWPLDYRR